MRDSWELLQKTGSKVSRLRFIRNSVSLLIRSSGASPRALIISLMTKATPSGLTRHLHGKQTANSADWSRYFRRITVFDRSLETFTKAGRWSFYTSRRFQRAAPANIRRLQGRGLRLTNRNTTPTRFIVARLSSMDDAFVSPLLVLPALRAWTFADLFALR